MSDQPAPLDENRFVPNQKDDDVERTGVPTDDLPESKNTDPPRSDHGPKDESSIISGEEEAGTRENETTDNETPPEPSSQDLSEPSTEKEPGEEPKAPAKPSGPQPSHKAVGIGVVGRPQTELDETQSRV